jgi:putative Ca2+/H+ antiporter (TMEM165/GDT1 family)
MEIHSMALFSLVASTFCIIFIAELPDKTALAALILATKYKARDVIVGAWLAFLVQTIVAVAAGSVLTLLPAQPIRVASGIGFLVFSFLALRRKQEEDLAKEANSVAATKAQKPAWLLSFLIIFAAEWGDLTQLATAALVARDGHPLAIGLGAVLGLWAVTVLAAFSGAKLSSYLKPQLLNIISGVLFSGIGLYIIFAAIL